MTDSSDNLGMPSMKPVEPPEAGYEPMPGPTVRLLDPIPVPYGRDAQSDSRRMTETGGDDGDLDDRGYLSKMDVTSLGTEKRRMGWDPLATPYGGTPAPANTSGTRGGADIGKIQPDGSLP